MGCQCYRPYRSHHSALKVIVTTQKKSKIQDPGMKMYYDSLEFIFMLSQCRIIKTGDI